MFGSIIMTRGQNVCLDEILDKFEIGSSDSKTRSLLEKPCICSRGHIFSPKIMKPVQHACLDETKHKFENGSCQVKN